jgi:hypothetical protein
MHQFWRKWFDGAPDKLRFGAHFNIGRLEKQRYEQRQKPKFNVQTNFTARCVYATVKDAIRAMYMTHIGLSRGTRSKAWV